MPSQQWNEQAPASYRARFETSKGAFTVEVTRAWAPQGADRFYNLVKNGFFNDARFFRVLPGFVVQFGIPGDPALAKQWRGARIPDDPVAQSNIRGAITFATAGPDTRTTQVFINLGNNRNLDSMGFAPFGTIREGMDIVTQLYSGYGERPDQGRLQAEGNAYLEKSFPNLDYVRQATIEAAA